MADCIRQEAEVWGEDSASVLTRGKNGAEHLEIDYKIGSRWREWRWIGRPVVDMRWWKVDRGWRR